MDLMFAFAAGWSDVICRGGPGATLLGSLGGHGYLGLVAGCCLGTHCNLAIAGITILSSAVLKQDKRPVWMHLHIKGSEE